MNQTFGEVKYLLYLLYLFLGLHKVVCTQEQIRMQSMQFDASCLITRALRKAIMITAMGMTTAYSPKTSRELDKHIRERGPLFPT